MRARAGGWSGLIASGWLVCAVALSAGEAPQPEPAPNAPDAQVEQPAPAPPNPGAPAATNPTAEELAALAKTVRFLDAFPGSPADRDELLRQYALAEQGKLDPNTPPVEVWAQDPVGAWMKGPVPTRITPTMMLLAWQKVLSEHYPATLLTFAPRLRAWCLRVLERIGDRRAALAAAVQAGEADKKLEHARLTDMAVAFRQAVLMLPGPSDRTAGLPDWVRALPAGAEQPTSTAYDAGILAGMPPWFSENLAAEQTFHALMSLQLNLALRGEQRMNWGPLTIGLTLREREDFQLLEALNRWIDEYSATATVNNDFLSLAAMAQAPRDPAAVVIWQADLARRRQARVSALKAAGCGWPKPNEGPEPLKADFGEDWRLLPWRCNPLDQISELEAERSLTTASASQRLRAIELPAWEALFADDTNAEAAPARRRPSMVYAVQAIMRQQGARAEAQLLDWCLLSPVNFVRSPSNPAPLRDDEALGPVWVDGGSAFYAALAQAALAHGDYLKMLGMESGNASKFARICEGLAGWASAEPTKTIGMPPTDAALRELLQARQWLAQWLQIDIELLTQRRQTPALLRSPHGASIARLSGFAAQVPLEWTLEYSVRPQSRSGLETAEPTAGPLLTTGIALRRSWNLRPATPSGWTPLTLQTAVLGPDRKGPVRYLDALSPHSVDFETSDQTRRKLRVWFARDPAGIQTAIEACPYYREGDYERLLFAAMTVTPDREELLEAILVAHPNSSALIYRALEECQNQAGTAVLAELAMQPGHVGAAAYMVRSYHQMDKQEAFLEWLQKQPHPEAGLTALLDQPHRSWAPIWLDWYDAKPAPEIRALLLSHMAPLLTPRCEPFRKRVERGMQIADHQPWHHNPGSAVNDHAPQADLDRIPRLLRTALKTPGLQPVAVAGLAMSDREDAYAALEGFFADPANVGFAMDPAHVILLGTSRVTGLRAERGRELLRSWVRVPPVDAAGKPRPGTLAENETWALAVDLLERQYLLTDEDLPALVERYIQEIGADLVAPRMRFPTHGAFATAYFMNAERTLDLIAAALGSAETFRRDAALAILTTQTRVDALNGARPVDLPTLENLPLRLEEVAETQRKEQTAAWQRWLQLRRGAILEQIRAHLE